MILFYSGSCGALPGRKLVGEPEIVLRGGRRVFMLSYYLITNRMQDQKLRLRHYVQSRKTK